MSSIIFYWFLRLFSFRSGKRSKPKESGAALVEIVISIPIFLLSVFVIMWAGFTYNSKTAFVSAVNNGVRLAVTRGQSELMRVVVIEDISSWDGTCVEADDFPAPLVQYFVNGQDGDELCQAYQALLGGEPTMSDNPINILALNFEDAPDSYLFALIYVQEALKLSLGASAVRYPCNPDDMDDGAGCLRCVFEDIFEPAYLNPEKMVLHCKYQPDSILIRPIQTLLSLIGQPLVLYHAAYAE
jgi:hypothetical protein